MSHLQGFAPSSSIKISVSLHTEQAHNPSERTEALDFREDLEALIYLITYSFIYEIEIDNLTKIISTLCEFNKRFHHVDRII